MERGNLTLGVAGERVNVALDRLGLGRASGGALAKLGGGRLLLGQQPAELGDLGRHRAGFAAELRDLVGKRLVAGDGVVGRDFVAGDGVAQLGKLTRGRFVARDRLAHLGQLVGQLGRALLLLAHRLDAGAQRIRLALQVVHAAAVVVGDAGGLGALDGDRGQLLANGVGVALDVLDALEGARELGAGGLALALAFALQSGDRLGELDACGLRSRFVLGAEALDLPGDVGSLGEAGVEAAGGLSDRLGRALFGGGDGLGEPGIGDGFGGVTVAFQLVEAGGQA